MQRNLRCKRATPSQSATTGVLSNSLSILWTRWMNLVPAESASSLNQNLRETPADVDARNYFNIYVNDTTIDVANGDLLVEMNGLTETDVIYKVRGIERWTTVVTTLIERIEE